MGTISVSLPSDGTTADAADYNTPINTIVNEFNGNIDNANIKAAAAIATSKLADDAGIGTNKITDSAITAAKAGAGLVVQVVKAQASAAATGTTTIPRDDTIPQNTEGTEYLTLAITPKSATNILVIEFTGVFAFAGSATDIITALFQDSTANALAATLVRGPASNSNMTARLTHTMTAGTTSATTFKIRAGSSDAGTLTFNGNNGTRLFGGVCASAIVIYEYKA